MQDKLVSVGDLTSSTRSAYAYDGDGNRIQSVVASGGTTKTTNYLNDTNTAYTQVLEERDDSGTLQARYDYGDGDLQKLYRLNTSTDAYQTRWYLNDGLESTRQLVDTNGVVTDSYAYDAFGNTADRSGDTTNSRLYNGQQQDDTGLYFLRARYMNTQTGRFLSQDPLMGSSRDPSSLHRYLYANTDAVNFCDPSGQESLVETIITSAINTTVETVKTNAVIGALNLFANQLVFANFLGDYGLHSVNGRNGLAPDGIMLTTQAQIGYSVVGASFEGGLYFDIDALLTDGVFYMYGSVGGSVGTVPFGEGLQRGASTALGLTYNTFDPSQGKNDPARLNGYGFNASWPLPLANFILRANPAFASLKAAGTLLPFFQQGSISLSVSANGDLLKGQGPSANFDGAAVMSYSSNTLSSSLSTGASWSFGFGSPIPIGQFASVVARTGCSGLFTAGQILGAAAQLKNREGEQ